MAKSASINILQLSDTHLQADRAATLYQVCTWANLHTLLETIKPRMESIDAIFLSGDVSQDETPESYQHIAVCLRIFGKPIYWLAGNHDAPQVMHATLAAYRYFHPLSSLTLGAWQFLALNTVKQGHHDGYLEGNTAALIQENTFCALWMHHHPSSVGSALIDKYKLQNPQVLSAFLAAQKKRPELMITGHVHGAYRTHFESIPVISSPATCFQFPKEASTVAVDPRGGCTFWQFHPDGTFDYEYVYTQLG